MSRLVCQQAFTLNVRPVPKGRGRSRIVDGHPIIYTPNETREAEAEIRELLHAAGAFLYPRGVPVSLRVTFGTQRPKDGPRREHYSPRRPDLPNFLMLVCDAGTGVLWDDDAQIVTVEATKEHMDRPRVILATGVPLVQDVPTAEFTRMTWERIIAALPGYQ